MENLYFIEASYTACGEPEYSWETQYVIKAKSINGAINRFSRLSGTSCRHDWAGRYNSKSGLTYLFISKFDDFEHGQYRFAIDDRS